MANEIAMQLALNNLESSGVPNFPPVARKHKIDRTTLLRRFKRQNY